MLKTKNWNKNWIKSKNPKKQRKYRKNAPLHIKSKLLCSHLSKELIEKYKRRAVRVRKGDKVKIMRGSFKGKTGKVERVNIKNGKAYITGIEFIKKDGSKSLYPINPSKLLVVELDLSDKKRIEAKK